MMMRNILVVGLTALFLGCGGGASLDTHPVKGKVTDGDKPLEGVGVSLVGAGGGGVVIRGTTDASGRFELGTVGGQVGAPAGDYKVVLMPPTTDDSYMDEGAAEKKEVAFPDKYTDAAKAESFSVTTGENVLNIDISK